MKMKSKINFKALLNLFRHGPVRAAALIIISMIILVAIFSDVLAPQDINNIQVRERLKPPVGIDGSDPQYLLGTDGLGRDLLSLIIHGARVSMAVGAAAVGVAGIIGVTLGLIAGYVGKFWGNLIMRIGDMQLAFPPILLYIAAMAILQPSLLNVILVLGVGQWVVFARVVRGEVLYVREKEYCSAARVAGASDLRMVLKHILPNVTASIIVVASFSVANSVVSEASLSFLGLGVPADTPSWGRILSEARPYLRHSPWLVILPSAALFFTIISINILGDWLRDYRDPTLKS